MSRAVVLACLVGAGLLVAPPAQAAAPRLVLTLRPADAGALRAAALHPPRDAVERAARLRAAAPAPRDVTSVRTWLASHGYRVEAATAWTITARGPRPTTLPPGVLSVVTDTDRAFQPRSLPAGYGPTALRSAYAATGDGAGTTVATVQFSGWRAADVQVYARAAGVALRAGQVTTVAVGGASPTAPDGLGGDYEAALDVESVLATAPAAAQRVYVAPNSDAGAALVYDALASYAQDHDLAAVSTSWGQCEPDTSPALVASMELSLARLVAAGATVLAASGDSGAYDCSQPGAPDARVAVDYPGSSPSVLSVGGTTLLPDGDGWTESAWSSPADASGYAGGAGGGGLSALFARPAWQSARWTRRAVPDLAAVADPDTGLGVYGPDGDGDGGSAWSVAGGTSASAPLQAGLLASAVSSSGRSLGLGDLHVPLYAAPTAFRDVVTGTNHRDTATRGYDVVTGLGTPQWSALAPTLLRPAILVPPATAGLVVPVSTYAPASRTARYALGEGATCADATAASVPATATLGDGPDRTTTVTLVVRDGATCTSTAASVRLDRTRPTALASLRGTARPGVLGLSWSGRDLGAGVAALTWTLRRADGVALATGTTARAGAALRAVPRGAAYRLEVVVRDAVGNTSAVASSRVTA